MDRRKVVQAGFVVVALALAMNVHRRPPLGVAPAAACSCNNQAPPSLQPFSLEIARPRNARLRLAPIWILPDKPEYGDWARRRGYDGAKWNLELRRKDAPRTSAPVPTEQRVLGDDAERTLELWPTAPLDARAAYVLTPKGSNDSLAELTTTDAIDTTPPTWSGPTRARYLPTGLDTKSSCEVGAPLVEITVTPPKDDQTAPDDVVIGVWRKSAPDGPPLTLSRVLQGRILLGRVGLCSEEDFRPVDGASLVLRAIDLAGNASDAHAIDVHASPLLGGDPGPGDAPASGCARACGKH